MVRESNETFTSYVRRILANDELDKGEQYKIIFKEDVAYDTARKQLRGVQNFLDLLDEEELSNVSDESVKNRINNEKEEIIKERIKLSVENTEKNRILREQAKQDLINEKIVQAIHEIEIAPPPKIIVPAKNDLELVLCVADQHVGCEFDIKDLKGQTINKYNNQIFEQRMWQVFSKTLSYNKEFKKIKIFDLSDAIEGILHFSQLMNLRYGSIDSAIYYGKFMLRWLNELSNKFVIEIGMADANHTEMRIMTGKKNDFPQENLTKVIRAMIEIGTANNPNITLLSCTDVGSVYTQVSGFDVLSIHGHDEKSKLEEIYRDYNSFYPNNIDYILIGHLHYNESVNKNIIRVPSIVGTNTFSEKIKKRSDAGAEILIFEKEVGLVEQHHIHLN